MYLQKSQPCASLIHCGVIGSGVELRLNGDQSFFHSFILLLFLLLYFNFHYPLDYNSHHLIIDYYTTISNIIGLY